MTPNKLDINLFQNSSFARELSERQPRRPIPFAAVALILAAVVALASTGANHYLRRVNFGLSSQLAQAELKVAESSNEDIYREVRRLNAYNQASSLYIGYLAGRDRLNSGYFTAVSNCAGADVLIDEFHYDGAALDIECRMPYPGDPADFVQRLNSAGTFASVIYRGCTELKGEGDSPDMVWFVLTCELK